MKATWCLVLAVLLVVPGSALAQTTDEKPAVSKQVDLEMRNVSVKDAIAKLFEGRDVGYYLEAGVTGKIVELRLKGITLEQALKAIAEAADLTYTIEGGTYIIGPKKPVVIVEKAPAAAEQPVGAEPSQPPSENTASPDAAPGAEGAPVYFGELPEVYAPPYYYPYEPYAVGSINILPNPWRRPPVVIAGGVPLGGYVVPPPTLGWAPAGSLGYSPYRYYMPRPYGYRGYRW